ncbi:MAG: response regulator [Planctomycetes bacterium]|nr:response regulator [Planctomycetota bacterium]
MDDDSVPPPEPSPPAVPATGKPPTADASPLIDQEAQRAELIARAKERTRRIQEQARISFETRRLRREARRAAEGAIADSSPQGGPSTPLAESSEPTPTKDPPPEPVDPEVERLAMIARAKETTRRIQEQAKTSFETRRLRRETRKVEGEPPAAAAGESPREEAASDPTSPPDSLLTAPRTGPKRVLVVDDSRPVRQILLFLLQKSGYCGLEAVSGGEALIFLRKSPVDLVLLDVMMHPIDGYTVLHQIRETPALRSLPVILLTARNQREDILRAVKEGANDFVLKPFQNSALMAKVRALLGDPPESPDPPSAPEAGAS